MAAADGGLLVAPAKGVCGILNNAETVMRRQLSEARHITGLTGEVHRYHDLWQAAVRLCTRQLVLQGLE